MCLWILGLVLGTVHLCADFGESSEEIAALPLRDYTEERVVETAPAPAPAAAAAKTEVHSVAPASAKTEVQTIAPVAQKPIMPSEAALPEPLKPRAKVVAQKEEMKPQPKEEQQSCEKMAGVRRGSGATQRWQDNSRLQVGGNYTRAHFKIKGMSSFNGNLGGAQGIYEFRPMNNFYAALSVNWKQGKTDNGQADRWLVYADAHERFGYTFATSCKNWTASFFTGLGYRHMGHKLVQGATRIKFQYNEIYVPLGIVSDYMFNSVFAGGLNFIWEPQVYPTVKIAPLKGARWIIKRSIDNFLAELPLTFTLSSSRRYTLIFKPFYEYWRDGKSTAKTSSGFALGLPGNTYNFWGAEVNFGFSF